jgi:hypothetical protein
LRQPKIYEGKGGKMYSCVRASEGLILRWVEGVYRGFVIPEDVPNFIDDDLTGGVGEFSGAYPGILRR